MTDVIRRVRATYGLEKVDRLFRTEFYFWPQTIERWKREGLPEDYAETNLFGYDENPFAEQLIDLGWVDPPFWPPYQKKTIKENADFEVVQDTTGTVKKILKGRVEGHEGMPQYIKSCVASRKDWEEDVKYRLNPDNPERWTFFQQNKDRIKEKITEGQKLYSASIIGGYMHLRNLSNPTKLLYLFHDDPSLIHDIMKNWLHLMVTAICRVQDCFPIFRLFLAEDICYKTGPLISPRMIKTFLVPYYRELYQTLQNRQTEKIFFEIDTDGAGYTVIDTYREASVSAFSPNEVAAGCDVVSIGRKYHWLMLSGGIDKRIMASSREAIDRETERIIPTMLKRGGYFPTCDHGIPEDVSLNNYLHYRKRVLELDCKTY